MMRLTCRVSSVSRSGLGTADVGEKDMTDLEQKKLELVRIALIEKRWPARELREFLMLLRQRVSG
jgi:hypothetical protein